MNKKLYTIRDNKIGTYLAPTSADHEFQLTRTLSEIVLNKDHNFGKYPSDYELHELGEFNVETAEITLLDKPKFILTLNELVKKD